MKFGGSSLASREKIENITRLSARNSYDNKLYVVLSAFKGITDKLVECTRKATIRCDTYHAVVNDINTQHIEIVKNLFPPKAQTKVITSLQLMINDLEEILHGVELIKECSPRILDLIMSFGERMSCSLVSHYMQTVNLDAIYIDARDLIVTDDTYGQAMVDFAASYKRIKKRLMTSDGIPIITGFISATSDGVTTTLGRNGSDYTASLIAAGVDADRIEIWTDVGGVMSTDPAFVAAAFVIPELSYQEAMELSYFGARVLHPYTMIPAVEKKIPILIKNSLNPQSKGTLITEKIAQPRTTITGIASIDDVALVNVEGGGMIGIPGIAARIFGALAKESINIMLISQASSEHSICLVFRKPAAERAMAALQKELKLEIETKRIQNFDLLQDLVVIAIIGENMRGAPGITGKLFGALGQSRINILAIAQGSSERNISFVIAKKDQREALNTIHRAFLEEF